MSGLRYVGASPSNDESIVTKGYAEKVVRDKTSNQIDHRQRARDLANSYLTSAEVDSRFSDRLSHQALSQEKAKYVSYTDLGRTVVSLSEGKIPTNQLPPEAGRVANPTGLAYEFSGYRTYFSGIRGTTLRTFSVSDPGYGYSVLCFGNAEVENSAGTEIYLEDPDGNVLASGRNTRGNLYSWVPVSPTLSGGVMKTYTGSNNFYLSVRSLSSGSGYVTNWKQNFFILVVPS